ncbi:MAG: hypothetical protein IIC07_04615, partial [Proteobacteria bacterium]|nr:hypothetical protein [Pseudomonadota bacterium]
MRRTLISIVSALILMSTTALANEALYQAIDEDYAYLEELYLYLHQNPELSYQEEQTMARIAGELRGLGFEVTENVGGFGLVGVLENGDGPTVLIRTDLDALPLKEQTGLPAGATITLRSVVVPKRTFYLQNTAVRDNPASYQNQLLVWTDTMSKGTAQLEPADKAVNAGVSLSTTDLTMTAILSWKAMPGATSYQYQIARDTE